MTHLKKMTDDVDRLNAYLYYKIKHQILQIVQFA